MKIFINKSGPVRECRHRRRHSSPLRKTVVRLFVSRRTIQAVMDGYVRVCVCMCLIILGFCYQDISLPRGPFLLLLLLIMRMIMNRPTRQNGTNPHGQSLAGAITPGTTRPSQLFSSHFSPALGSGCLRGRGQEKFLAVINRPEEKEQRRQNDSRGRDEVILNRFSRCHSLIPISHLPPFQDFCPRARSLLEGFAPAGWWWIGPGNPPGAMAAKLGCRVGETSARKRVRRSHKRKGLAPATGSATPNGRDDVREKQMVVVGGGEAGLGTPYVFCTRISFSSSFFFFWPPFPQEVASSLARHDTACQKGVLPLEICVPRLNQKARFFLMTRGLLPWLGEVPAQPLLALVK